MKTDDYLMQINEFENKYNYDTTYMRELLETSPEGYKKFDKAMPLVSHHQLLGLDEYWIAKLAAMKSEDCGECLQLNVRIALECGVTKDIIKACINGGGALSDDHKDVYDFATRISCNTLDDDKLIERINIRFNKGQLLEFGLCISTAKFFPTTKRALGYTKSCSLIEIQV